MKRIFRSIIDIRKDNRSTLEQEDLVRNYRSFLASTVEPEDPSYIKLYHWIEAHFREYKEIPSIHLLVSRAEKEGDEAILSSLKEIVTETPFIRSDYKQILKEKFEEQCKDKLQNILTKTWQAANEGIKLKRKELKGISKAIEYFIGESRKLRMKNLSIKTEANIKSEEDSSEVIEDYAKRKADPLANLGMYTFLDRIDNTCRGLKPGELMLVAAYVKQGKTITVSNFAYNGIMQGLNGLFVTLEMNFQEMRDLIYVLHSCNPEWLDNGKFKSLVGKVTYDKVRYGELSDLEEQFFKQVGSDFASRTDFGDLFIYQPSESLSPSNLEMIAYDYHAKLRDEGKTLDFLIVDYIGLMVPDAKDRYGDFNVDLNNTIRKLKNLALNFDGGQMLRVISPFQINRTGHKDAEKNDGIYKLSALSNANEAERSCDLIISTYMSEEMKKAGIIKFGCMAHRKGANFDPFEANIEFGTRQIRDFIQNRKSEFEDKESAIKEIPLDA